MKNFIRKLILVEFLMVFLSCKVVFGYNSFWTGQNENTITTDEWFDQKLDHFAITNNATWKQRFYTNSEYFIDKNSGPIFLMIGGEGDANTKLMKKGAWIHYAKEYNALCFQLEHRYYGKSHPTKDISTENLVYLSSQQALADLANFIESMNEKFNLDRNSNKWIAFGGSYAGSLAAWLRQKYPHLVHGAISTSAPLLAIRDFHQYFEVVAKSLATYSVKCVPAIQKGIKQVELQLNYMIGQRNLNKKFKLCDPIEKSIENPLDISNLFKALAGNFASAVQYNISHIPNWTMFIDKVCGIMENETIGLHVTRLAQVNSLVLDAMKEKCLDYKYDKMIANMKQISWDNKILKIMRQWTYQTCTEFGFFQTSDAVKHIFGNRFPVEFFIQQCMDIYGKEFNDQRLSESIRRTNIFYGELFAKTTNVLFVHGSIDPWHSLGLIKSTNPHMPTIYIEGTAHCANIFEPHENDLPQLKDARIKINQFIKELLITQFYV